MALISRWQPPDVWILWAATRLVALHKGVKEHCEKLVFNHRVPSAAVQGTTSIRVSQPICSRDPFDVRSPFPSPKQKVVPLRRPLKVIKECDIRD